jgi:PAS domain S-box-containing protein/diguanylate cyclase (GGDEF)-like protein
MKAQVPRLIRILLLEHAAADAALVAQALHQAGLNIRICQVDNQTDYRAQLDQPDAHDIILSDLAHPDDDGLSALILRAMLAPALPFIFVAGEMGEERIVEMLHIGASDYVHKANLSRLPMAVLRALAEADAARIQAETELQLDRERQLLSTVLDTSEALIVLLDHHGLILRLNPAAGRVLGLQDEQVCGKEYSALFSSLDERPGLQGQLERLFGPAPPAAISWRSSIGVRIIQWSASRLPFREDSPEFAVVCGLDITAREQAEQHAFYLMHFDAATGLPNRAQLILRLRHLQDDLQGLALLLIDLPRLQEVRGSLGRNAANQLLREVARRLLSWQGISDCLARVGDNSFALLIKAGTETELDTLLQNMLSLLHAPYSVDGHGFFLTPYLGIAHCREQDEPEAILQAATMAQHQAMLQHEARFHFYQPVLSDEARARLELEGELLAALGEQDQLFLDYQPQAELSSGRIVGLEALMRWQHPRHGLLPPGKFIPLAESCGLIAALGERALQLACRQAAEWQRAGLAPVPVAVNLSALQWTQPGLVETVRAALDNCGLEPRWLELELTESASMRDPTATLATMETLHAMGVQISIDDFGTGFCNLGYLKRFPVDKLKIDQSFVREVTSLQDDRVISELVVAMGHLLHLQVVAEGVETEGQLIFLTEASCDIVQGFYFSRPASPEACAEMLRQDLRLPPARRHRQGPTILWLDPVAPLPHQIESWLAAEGYSVLAAVDAREAFEALASHQVGMVVCASAMTDMPLQTFLHRLGELYPPLKLLVLGDAPQTSAPSLPLPLQQDALLAVLQQAFAVGTGP